MGTSSSVPTQQRGLSSVAILRGSELLLFDAGEGAQRALVAANLGLNRKTKIFITHLHGDHCVGLLGLLQTMSMIGRSRVLHVYGPRGTIGFVQQNRALLHFDLTFPLHVHQVKAGVLVEEPEYVVKAVPAEHNVLTYAYCLEEKERPGVFYPERARELGVPESKLWSQLQHGRAVNIGGNVILPSQVLGPRRAGRKIGISGDTRPSPRLAGFFHGCDILVFDSTYGEAHADKAVENMHSTAREAATVAKQAGVRTLVLTHFSARYEDVSRLVAEAATIHPDVKAAEDLMQLEVPYPP